ncbi:MAG: hypothetical protein ACT4OM_10290 [Actinomycetota bacterium]
MDNAYAQQPAVSPAQSGIQLRLVTEPEEEQLSLDLGRTKRKVPSWVLSSVKTP